MNNGLKLILGVVLASSLVACGTAAKNPVADANAGKKGAVDSVESKKTRRDDARMDLNSILSKRTVHFDYDKYDIKPEYDAMIKAHAEYKKTVMANDGINFLIEGHADERGTREYNLALGQKRAVAVKDALVKLGIPEAKIETVSYGKEKPTCLEATELCYTENRRVNILYTDER